MVQQICKKGYHRCSLVRVVGVNLVPLLIFKDVRA